MLQLLSTRCTPLEVCWAGPVASLRLPYQPPTAAAAAGVQDKGTVCPYQSVILSGRHSTSQACSACTAVAQVLYVSASDLVEAPGRNPCQCWPVVCLLIAAGPVLVWRAPLSAVELETWFPLLGADVDALLQACQKVLPDREAAAVRAHRDVMVEKMLFSHQQVALRSKEDLEDYGMTPKAAAALKRVCSSKGVRQSSMQDGTGQKGLLTKA